MMGHQVRDGGQQLVERGHHLLGRGGVIGGGIADRLAHVLIEQLHRALGEPSHRGIGITSQPEEVGKWQTEFEQAQRDTNHLDVGGRVALCAVDGAAQLDALALHGLDQ